MNPHEFNALHIIHVLTAITAIGTIFYACAGAPETRKRVLMWSGITGMLLLITGIRMWQGAYGFEGGWVIVKLVCWLGLSAFAGLAYRKRENVGRWIVLTVILTALALVMVYVRPF